ncbi:energy transducer TonB [Gallaecimonas mangrovi]|uniref:energy transducer TonB n=1 Tax=Gallaecimonas mangrovi TaxID=2291597 RepID=UPI001D00CF18|nr:energy transducer TonB [Gallaecimonas mangrovi]
MTRYLSAASLAIIATLACLFFMTQLIRQHGDRWASPAPQSQVQVTAATLPPPKPPQAKPGPQLPKPKAIAVPGIETLAPSRPSAVTPVMSGDPQLLTAQLTPPQPTLAKPTFNGSQDGEATPMLRMEPRYPPAAARDGKEGWVKLRFSINTAGLVDDIHVVDAYPRHLFDRAAIEALRKWRYKPQIKAGKPAPLTNQEVVLDFKLNQPA